MKFTCNTKKLKEACSNVMKAVSQKVTIPTIEGILIECGNEIITLTGYDFEFAITTSMLATVTEPGAIVVNAKTLNNIVRSLSAETTMIETNGNSVTIISGTADFKNVSGIDADDYPELPSVSGGYPLFIEKEMLLSMFDKTAFAVALNENSKPVHTGLKFELTLNQLRLIGVDGYRLAVSTEKINYEGEDFSFVVPKKTIDELRKLTGVEEEKNISISVGRRHIVFEIGDYSIISRLLDGDFLDYKSAVPKTKKTTVIINTRDAIECINSVVPIVENNAKNPIRCVFNANELRISTISSLGGAQNHTRANIDGERVEIGFNSKYMQDALRAADTDEVRIELEGPVSPVKIMPVNDERFLFLVLPMRLKSEN